MSSEEYKYKTKCFLERKLTEYKIKINKLKRRRKIVKTVFVTLITLSVTCSAACAALCAFSLPPVIIPLLSSTGAVATVLSLKFNLEGRKEQLNNIIEALNKIKNNIDYVVSCNGDFTETEYQRILHEVVWFFFRNFYGFKGCCGEGAIGILLRELQWKMWNCALTAWNLGYRQNTILCRQYTAKLTVWISYWELSRGGVGG